MDPSFGSGSQLLGDTSALEAAMAESGVPVSALNKVSGSAPTAQPNMAPAQLPQANAPQPKPASAGAPAAPTGLPAGNPEAQMIVRALGSRLGGLTKMGQ